MSQVTKKMWVTCASWIFLISIMMWTCLMHTVTILQVHTWQILHVIKLHSTANNLHAPTRNSYMYVWDLHIHCLWSNNLCVQQFPLIKFCIDKNRVAKGELTKLWAIFGLHIWSGQLVLCHDLIGNWWLGNLHPGCQISIGRSWDLGLKMVGHIVWDWNGRSQDLGLKR